MRGLDGRALRDTVQLQARSGAQNGTGDERLDWATWATRPAAVEPIGGGREFVAAQARNARAPYRFTLRRLDGVAPKQRVLWEGRIFDIQSAGPPKDDVKRRWLVIVADELVGKAATP